MHARAVDCVPMGLPALFLAARPLISALPLLSARMGQKARSLWTSAECEAAVQRMHQEWEVFKQLRVAVMLRALRRSSGGGEEAPTAAAGILKRSLRCRTSPREAADAGEVPSLEAALPAGAGRSPEATPPPRNRVRFGGARTATYHPEESPRKVQAMEAAHEELRDHEDIPAQVPPPPPAVLSPALVMDDPLVALLHANPMDEELPEPLVDLGELLRSLTTEGHELMPFPSIGHGPIPCSDPFDLG